MRNLTHLCDVMAPPDAHGGYGEGIGNDGVYIRSVPCSLEHLSGREGEIARATFGGSNIKVGLYGDPRKPITKRHKLKIGDRLLHIADVNDKMQNGREYELICGEDDG